MKIIFALLLSGVSVPAIAQTQSPAPAAAPASSTTCLPEHAAMGHCTLPAPSARQAPVAPVTSATCSLEHAAMGHCTIPSTGSADPHTGHAPTAASPPVAPAPPGAFSGPKHAADAIYGEAASARAREQLRDEHGNIVTGKLLVEQLEVRMRDGRDSYAWDAQGWYGGDTNKLWVKSEGEGSFGESPEQAEVQALYSRAINPWFNLQGGVRHDFQPNPERTHLVLGIQGLAPYWFEVDGALFLSNKGDLTARFEAEYDQRITQKLILQPRIEFNLAAQDVPELGIGAGLSTAEAGLRLRYEFIPEFAPYIGVEYERAFGNTADFARAEGEKAGSWSLLTGIRMWF